MKTYRKLLALALPMGLASLALAQTTDANPGPRGGGRRPPNPLVRALDADYDGVISAGEIASAASSLRVLDTNADGKLSDAELHPAPPADARRPSSPPPPPADGGGQTRAQRPHPRDPIMTALDTDGDGELSAVEIANAPASLKKLDKNGDGQLTPDEFRPAGGPGREGPPHKPDN
jgi:Ca2+-binding EF-hand superfamily protein